jgi:hypothetical protein
MSHNARASTDSVAMEERLLRLDGPQARLLDPSSSLLP